MAGLNKMTIIGNLGRDPEVRYAPDGLAIANFSVAVNEKIKGEDQTTWYKVAVFGKQAEVCAQYLTKGSQVYVEGRLKLEEWTDREGALRHSLAINTNFVNFLGGGSGGGGSDQSYQGQKPDQPKQSYDRPAQQRQQPPKAPPTAAPDEDDIPF